MAALIDSPTALLTTAAQDDSPALSEIHDLVDMAGDAYAPVTMFGSTRVDIVEELAFRALFAVAAVVTTYGVVASF